MRIDPHSCSTGHNPSLEHKCRNHYLYQLTSLNRRLNRRTEAGNDSFSDNHIKPVTVSSFGTSRIACANISRIRMLPANLAIPSVQLTLFCIEKLYNCELSIVTTLFCSVFSTLDARYLLYPLSSRERLQSVSSVYTTSSRVFLVGRPQQCILLKQPRPVNKELSGNQHRQCCSFIGPRRLTMPRAINLSANKVKMSWFIDTCCVYKWLKKKK